MWETVITDAGVNIIAGLMDGGTILVSSVQSGAGSASSLKSQTAVSQQKQTATIQKIERVNDYIQITALFSNQGLSAGYGMKQVGIFVKSDSKDVLFAIAQTDTAKEIPSESASPSYSLLQKFRFQFKNDVSMTAEIDAAGLCSMELYHDLEDRVESLEKGDPAVMQGATSDVDGTAGLVPAPKSAERANFLKGDGSWGSPAMNAYFYLFSGVTKTVSYSNVLSSVSNYTILRLYTVIDDTSALGATYIVNGNTVILVESADGDDTPVLTYGAINNSSVVKLYGYRVALKNSSTSRTVLVEKHTL